MGHTQGVSRAASPPRNPSSNIVQGDLSAAGEAVATGCHHWLSMLSAAVASVAVAGAAGEAEEASVSPAVSPAERSNDSFLGAKHWRSSQY